MQLQREPTIYGYVRYFHEIVYYSFVRKYRFIEVPETITDDHRHKLKLAKMFFDDMQTGKKPFDLQKNDREYQLGDIIEYREMDNGEPTGRILEKEIIYILEGFAGLTEGWCILALADIVR